MSMSASSEPQKFNHDEAIARLRDVEEAMDRYYALTGRNAQDDIDLRVRLADMYYDAELTVPWPEAMHLMYDANLRPSIHGDDTAWAQAEWDSFLDEVTDATEYLHIRLTEEA